MVNRDERYVVKRYLLRICSTSKASCDDGVDYVRIRGCDTNRYRMRPLLCQEINGRLNLIIPFVLTIAVLLNVGKYFNKDRVYFFSWQFQFRGLGNGT